MNIDKELYEAREEACKAADSAAYSTAVWSSAAYFAANSARSLAHPGCWAVGISVYWAANSAYFAAKSAADSAATSAYWSASAAEKLKQVEMIKEML